MKKRIFSMILALTMVFSLFSGLTFTASAEETYTGTFNKITDFADMTDGGLYIFVGNGNSKAMRNDNVASNWIYPSDDTYTGDTVTNPDASILWTVTNGIISPYGETKALYASADKKIELSSTDSTTWSFTISSSVWNIGNDTVGNLRFNSTGWRPYKSSTGTAGFQIYKLDSGGEPPHTHTWGEGVETTAATCTAEGVMTYTCTDPDCGATKTEAIPMIPHKDEDANDVCDSCLNPIYKAAVSLSNGDQVVVYNPAAAKAMSPTVSGNKFTAMDVNDQNGLLAFPADNAPMVLTVEKSDNRYFYLKSGSDYLTCASNGNGLSLAAKSDLGLWYLGDPADNAVVIYSKDGVQNNQTAALEFYQGGFTTYGYNANNNGQYAMRLYTRPGQPPEPQDVIEVYLIDQLGSDQEDVKIYAWDPENAEGEWPGVKMTYEGSDAIADKEHENGDPHAYSYYSYQLNTANYTKIIFTTVKDGNLIQTPGDDGAIQVTAAMKQDGFAVFYLYEYGGLKAGLGDDVWKFVETTEANCTEPKTEHYKGLLTKEPYEYKIGEALGHDWGEWTVTAEPTCGNAGSKMRTCARCGETETEEIPKTPHAWGEPTYTWAADHSACTAEVVCGNNELHKITENGEISSEPGETGVTYTATFPTDRYPFEPQTEFVEYLDFGDKYFEKVASAETLTDGQYLIVYEDGKLAFDGSLETLDAIGNSIAVTLDTTQNKIVADENTIAAVFTINVAAGTIKSASGYYIGRETDANGMLTSMDTAYTHTISINDDGSAQIVSEGGAILRYNKASGNLRFRYFKSSTYTSQQPVALYKLILPCEHIPGDPVQENVVAATCTEEGSYDEVVYCTVCGQEISRETKTAEALGHAWGAPGYEWAADKSTCTATRVCTNDETHVETETAYTSYEITTPPGCETLGVKTYTAEFENEAFGTVTTTEEVPAVGHTWGLWAPNENGVETRSCTKCDASQTGLTIYAIDEHNGNSLYCWIWNAQEVNLSSGWPGEEMTKLGDDKDEHPYFKFVVPNDENEWKNVVINNSSQQTSDLDFVSDANGRPFVVYLIKNAWGEPDKPEDIFLGGEEHTHIEAPTCTEPGYIVYDGLLTDKVWKDPDPENPNPLGHEWGTPSYEWTETEDGWSCTATRVCAKDESHVETETVIANYAVTTQPGFDTPGVGTYTATFENEAFEKQTKTVDISALPALPTATVTEQEPLEGKPVFELPLDLQNPTPVATVEEIAAVYKFATTPTEDQAAYFAQWYCDYRVTFTDALDAGTFGLYGAYGTYDVSFLYPANVAAGSEVYLLQTLSMQTLKYYEVVGIGEFTCGAFNLIEENKNRAMKVELVIWDPTDPDTKYVLASENYRFGDPTAILCIEHSFDEVTYVWADDYSTCTATAECSVCHYPVTETVSTTGVVTKPATCEEAGAKTWTATFENEAFETQTKSETIPATGHAWGEPSYVWAADNSTVTATRTCANDPDHVETETVNTTNVITVVPTLETSGVRTYTATFENEAFATQTKDVPFNGEFIDVYVVDMTGSNDVRIWAWGEAGSIVPNVDGIWDNRPQMENKGACYANVETTPLACTYYLYKLEKNCFGTGLKFSTPAGETGTINYVSDAADSERVVYYLLSDNGLQASNDVSKSIWLFKEDHPATCETGSYQTFVNLFDDTDFKDSAPANDALGHNWGAPSYEWAADNSSVTATRVCGNDPAHVETETVSTTVTTTEATCEEAGAKTWTAAFENEAFETQTKSEEIPATGHAWGEPSYVWADDNSTVTATRTCANDPEHVETETVRTTVTTTEASCEEAGAKTWTAAFENEAFETQTKSEEIPATGHAWGEPSYVWADDNSTVTATRTCANDPEHVETETVRTTVTTTEASCEEAGAKTWTAAFENEAFETQTKSETIPATGHDWGTPSYKWVEAEDGWSCTGTAVCANDESHVLTEAANMTYAVTTEPTYENSGVGTWTATFTNEAFTTQTKDVEIPKLLADGVYLVGTFNNWKPNETTDKFTVNPNNQDEYQLATNLTAGEEIKVIVSENGNWTWYGKDGANYTVDAAHSGNVTIYFKTSYDNAWAEFGGYFYIAAAPQPMKITLYSDISLGIDLHANFKVVQSDVESFDHWYIEVTRTRPDGTVETKRFSLEDGNITITRNPMYLAVYSDIAAKEMGDHFQATFHGYDAEGNEIGLSDTVEYTLRDYILAELMKEDNDRNMRTLTADLLNYGAAAQIYFDYDAENLVNKNLSEAQQNAMNEFATDGEAEATLVNSQVGPNIYSSVSILNRIVLSLTVRNVGTPEKVQIEIKNNETGAVKDVVDAVSFNVNNKTFWKVKYSGFDAKDMRTAFDFTVLADGEETGTPITWSVEGYVREGRLNENSTEAERNLLNAMLNYVDAVARVFPNS